MSKLYQNKRRITENPFLNAHDVATRYSIGVSTVWRWSKSNQNNFPSPVSVGGSTRWRLTDLQKWEDALERVRTTDETD